MTMPPPPPPAMPPMPPAMPPVGGALPEHGPYTFVDAIKVCFSKYATFKGRARRSEFWYWTLFAWLVTMGANLLSGAGVAWSNNSGPAFSGLSPVVSLALMLPGLAAAVRRLHDTGRSGAWLLLPLGMFVLFLAFGATALLSGLAGLGGDDTSSLTGGSIIVFAVFGVATFASYILLIVWLAQDGGPNTANRYGVRS